MQKALDPTHIDYLKREEVNITPLIDGDWLQYLACQAVEHKLPDDIDPPFPEIADVFDFKIKEICNALYTKAAPILFFTGANNFRKELAKTKGYKANRPADKPFHHKNLKTYCQVRYDTRERGDLEADDLMSIHQAWQLEAMRLGGMHQLTCIVSPDKDLRMNNGWVFTPEGHNYPLFGPFFVTDENSKVFLSEKKPYKLRGWGWKFFYGQLITGDTVDNIPGLPLGGATMAVKLVGGTTTRGEAFEAVRWAYRDKCIMADDYLLEQARLLWMVNKMDEDKEPIMWTPPEVNNVGQ